MIKKITIIILLVLIPVLNLFAQEEKKKQKEHDDFWNEMYDWEDYDVSVRLRGMPTFGLYGGLNMFSDKGTAVKYNQTGNVELRLGYSDIYDYKTDYILKYKDNYFLLSNLSKDYYKKEDLLKADLSGWQFGFGWDNGYGYKLGQVNIILYKGGEALWTRVKTDLSSKLLSPADSTELSMLNETFRFGTSSNSGLMIQVANTVALDLNYKRAMVFPRHMFWYHMGSMIIEWAGEGLLDSFSKKVFNSSPVAGPIVNFVLKSAFSYGIYELRKEKMNWPFNTVSPLFNDQFSVGIKFTF